MTLNLPGRVILFGVAAVVVLILAGWRAAVAWQETNRLRASFVAGQQDTRESLVIADQFRAKVVEMNHALIQFGLHGRTEDRQDYEANRHGLEAWLDARTREAKNASTLRLMADISQAFAHYIEDAQGVLRAQASSREGIAPETLLARVEADSRTLLEFSRGLDASSREAMSGFFDDLDRSVRVLQGFTLGTVLALTVLISLLGYFVWRDLIAPLQARLSESWQRLEHQEKLSSLGALAAGVAHEVRNPLTSIKARAFTLTRLLPKGSLEHEDASVINNEITRLEKIVSDFLNFSRPPDPHPVLLDVQDLISDAARLLSPDLDARNVRLRLDFQGSLQVMADPAQLKQVLLNLIRNAADAQPKGGEVRIQALTTYTRLDRQQVPALRVDIADDGPGIPMESQRRIFDPFFTTKAKGTGLGLTIAARILEAHGGLLRYQTQPGRGTTFTLFLPLNVPTTPEEKFSGLATTVHS